MHENIDVYSYAILININVLTIASLHKVWAKDVKSCTNFCYVRCATLILSVGDIPWPQLGATHYHAQLGLQDKGRVIKKWAVCYVVSMVRIYEEDWSNDICKVRGFGPLLWTGWLSSSSTATPHINITT